MNFELKLPQFDHDFSQEIVRYCKSEQIRFIMYTHIHTLLHKLVLSRPLHLEQNNYRVWRKSPFSVIVLLNQHISVKTTSWI